MFATASRGLKVGAACWAAGLVATMLVGTLVIRGIAGAVVASFPGAVAFYLNGHGFLLFELLTGDVTTMGGESPIGPLAIVLLTLVALFVLLLGGAYVGTDADSPSQAIRAGATIALGYTAMTGIALLLLLNLMPLESTLSGARTSSALDGFALRVVVAGVVAPILVGAIGALAASGTEVST